MRALMPEESEECRETKKSRIIYNHLFAYPRPAPPGPHSHLGRNVKMHAHMGAGEILHTNATHVGKKKHHHETREEEKELEMPPYQAPK